MIFDEVCDELQIIPVSPVDVSPVPRDPVAVTAGEQDHSDPWRYAGPFADPPRNP